LVVAARSGGPRSRGLRAARGLAGTRAPGGARRLGGACARGRAWTLDARRRLGRGSAAAGPGANPRSGRTLKTTQRTAQTLELIVEPLVLRELIFDLLDARLDVLGDRADVGDLGHVSPPRVGRAS